MWSGIVVAELSAVDEPNCSVTEILRCIVAALKSREEESEIGSNIRMTVMKCGCADDYVCSGAGLWAFVCVCCVVVDLF